MGIWIRSQDRKTLVNASDVYIAKRGKGYCISTGRGNDLGTYEKEKNALYVLDMIQEKIIEIDNTRFLGMTETIYKECVFEMPKDEEV